MVNCQELALKKVNIRGEVIGKFGTFEIEQTFVNNTNEILEVGYTFPIVETATIAGFEAKVGDIIIRGECKEKNKARREYEENVVKGNSAYLMEQKADNVFDISIGKIDRGEDVKIKISYIDKFEIVDNKINILIPTLVTPRYKSDATSKLQCGKVDYTVDFTINISKALKVKNIECITNKINVVGEKIEILDFDMSKDFKLYIDLQDELNSNAIVSKTHDGKNVVYMSFMPEIPNKYEDREKDYIFLVDVSGSMMGRKLKETVNAVKECLRQLDNGDTFNIIAFQHDFKAMSLESMEYNEENLKRAFNYLDDLRASGGTEILKPIQFALYESNVEKIVLLFTDGQVGFEQEILSFVRSNIRKSKIFPFGIDTSVNSSFIRNLAKAGHGKAELIMPGEKIDDKILRTFARVQTPILNDISIDYGDNKVIDEIREDASLFNYEFYNVISKVEKLQGDIKLKGNVEDASCEWVVSKDNIFSTNVDLELIFAKMQIDRLEEYIKSNWRDFYKRETLKNMIVELSEKYNIASKYTSFISVYERDNKIFEVPTYQETTLSDSFVEEQGARMSKFAKRSKINISENDTVSDLDIPAFLRKSNANTSNTKKGFEAPALISRIKDSVTGLSLDDYCEDDDIFYETDRRLEKVSQMMMSYFESFKKNNTKLALTALLYALYFTEIGNKKEAKELLKLPKDYMNINEIYEAILCKIYMSNKKMFSKEEWLEVLGVKYRKMIETNADIDVQVNLKLISDAELKKIVKQKNIEENIDSILWYMCCAEE